MSHQVKQYQCSLQAHAVCLIIYKLTAPHFLKLLFPASVKILSQTTEKYFNDLMSSRKVIILQLSFMSWAWLPKVVSNLLHLPYVDISHGENQTFLWSTHLTSPLECYITDCKGNDVSLKSGVLHKGDAWAKLQKATK